MGREIYDVINYMAEILNASQMQKLQEVLVKRLSENNVSDYLQTTNKEFLDMFLTVTRLRQLKYRRINFLNHRYFMLYRIEDNVVFMDNILHELQDYENKMH